MLISDLIGTLEVVGFSVFMVLSAPPPVPNYCGESICVELTPVVEGEGKAPLTVTKSSAQIDGLELINFSFSDGDSIAIFGPVPAENSTPQVLMHKDQNRIDLVACMAENNAASCYSYIVTWSRMIIDQRPKVCNLSRVWLTQRTKNTIKHQLGGRLDVATGIGDYCLNY